MLQNKFIGTGFGLHSIYYQCVSKRKISSTDIRKARNNKPSTMER